MTSIQSVQKLNEVGTIRAASKINRRHRSGGRKDSSLKTGDPKKIPSMTCKKEVDFIADYLSSGLAPLQSKAFESHLKLCPDCVAFLKTYKKTVELTRVFLSGTAPSIPPRTRLLRTHFTPDR